MGREIKRVPLDFKWPQNEVWTGFVNPFYKECPEDQKTCFGGHTAAGQWLEAIARFLSVVGENGINGPRPNCAWPHPYLLQFPLAPEKRLPEEIRKQMDFQAYAQYHQEHLQELVLPPTRELGELVAALVGKKPDSLFGYGAIGPWAISQKLILAAGFDPKTWGSCPVCSGSGQHPALQAQYEAWKRTEPPAGLGWQVWETVSEGSPVSPVFETSEKLVDWLVAGGNSRFAAENFVKTGWVPSMEIGPGGKVKVGIECAGE